MFPEQLKKILNLIKKTGDRVVVFDANAPDDSYVIMGFDDYAEGFDCDCDCGSACEKCASDVPAAKAAKTQEAPINTPIKADLPADSVKTENLTEEDLTDKINREISMWKNRENSAYLGEESKPKKAWAIPSNVKNKAQEVE